ncbi:hypothetical protein R3W88_014374 [Solanum pinnatisectum]|uniref:Uncharacterized protein n=1 Tax=Solanum pinnatisectum TaxID=50273 RepID=A0AAV9KRF4_9SOLN|nr:hypothetical protein R3W88_014374 [Solanum pinnatisectum]
MNSEDGSVSRWLCRNCKRPITKKGYTTCECGCMILLSDDEESEEDCEVVENIGEDGRKRRMVEPSSGDKRRKFIPETCEEISDSS